MSHELLAFLTFFSDVREFSSGVAFARPRLLLLLIVPFVLAIVARLAARRQQLRVARIGSPKAVAALQLRSRSSSGFRAFVAVSMWVLSVVGVAGPRWGRQSEPGVAVGRDIVILLDFSRSMWAEDMAGRANLARWQAAVAASRELVELLRTRGGQRVAVVLFAARPLLLVPLTTDFDHLDFKLSELDATVPPAEIRPADDTAASGTRIGAAVRAAIAVHDPRFPGFQDILLLTDGDDPANDREWRSGITFARNANIPIFAVGLGDPVDESFVLHRGGPLESIGPNGVPAPIRTRLHEDVVESLALESLGAYLPSRTETPKLNEFYRVKMESNSTREVSDERLPQPKDRSAWFLGLALLLLLFIWWRER